MLRHGLIVKDLYIPRCAGKSGALEVLHLLSTRSLQRDSVSLRGQFAQTE